MGDTEMAVFQWLLIVGAVEWLLVTPFTTLRLADALLTARRAHTRVPFLLTSTTMGLIHVVVAVLFAAVTFWHPLWLTRVALYAIPGSTIVLGALMAYLGVVARRSHA